MKRIAYWDWRAKPLPDAEIVVCAPFAVDPGERVGDPIASDISYRTEQRFVVPFANLRDYEAWASEWVRRAQSPWGRHIIPALHVERQSDLANLGGLLATKADIRALVVSPREGIRLPDIALHGQFIECPDETQDLETDPCRGCPAIPNDGQRSGDYCGAIRGPRIDWILIVGGDEPVHPDWIRGIVRQAGTAGVPVTFLGWGRWHPDEHLTDEGIDAVSALVDTPDGERPALQSIAVDGVVYRDLGRSRSGALLDGCVVDERPPGLE